MSGFINIERVEFLATKRCNANCKHCSVPINSDPNENGYTDMDAIKKCYVYLAENYQIESIMVYGGEPLLCAEKIAELFRIASEYRIPVIDLITSGFISLKESKKSIFDVVDKLSVSGVKRILLSVDSFHQERIPIGYVEWFLERVVQLKFCEVFLHPAWLVSKDDDNVYNLRTLEILNTLSNKYGIGISEGNYIIPSGNNKKNIGSFYGTREIHMDKKCGEIPYTNPLNEIRSIRILPNGDINICRGMTIGNVFSSNIENVLETYSPNNTQISSTLQSKGIQGLFELAKVYGANINPKDYYGTCDFCADCTSYLKEREVN